MFNFFPKNELFFDLFESHVEEMSKAAKLLQSLIDTPGDCLIIVEKIHEVESAADEVTRRAIRHLVNSFITPLDREDIHALIGSLDDVVDHIDNSARSFVLFEVKECIAEYRRQVEILNDAVAHLKVAIENLRRPKSRLKSRAHAAKISELESDGDRLHSATIARLFREVHELRDVSQWQHLCSGVEHALDSCHEAGKIIEMIVLKTV